MKDNTCQETCARLQAKIKGLENSNESLREAYAELRERYNNEKVKTGRYDHTIF